MARGAVDDKGQMWMHVKAIESLMVASGTRDGGVLPVNLRVILEGEEEVGGEGIAKFVREHGERLKADVALVSDTEMFRAGSANFVCRAARDDLYGDRSAGREDGPCTPACMAGRHLIPLSRWPR